jgi:geranylgeranyl diphosphate synthase type I
VACGGDPGQARHAGAAVELVHNFSLIHDDVVDRDELRHGRATVWRRWGETNAIVLGDAIHALALAVLVDGVPDQVAAEAVMRLEIATINLCGGQYRDCAFETSPPVDLTEYLAMVEGKTGALLGVSCALGALCAGADHARVSQMYTFGCQLGVAFQIIDDALGIWGDPQLTGKPAGNDLLRYKQTYPVVFAMTSNTDSGRSLAGMYASLELSGPASVAQATRLIERTGGRTATQHQASHHVTAAFEALPPDLMTGDLEALARLVTSRKW